jgi:hypothetical protein
VTQPNLTRVVELLRSPEARPLIRETLWAGGVSIALIVLAALLVPAIAYAVYLAVALFFASALTGVFVSRVEAETGERLLESPALRRWLAGFAAVLAFLAAVILV